VQVRRLRYQLSDAPPPPELPPPPLKPPPELLELEPLEPESLEPPPDDQPPPPRREGRGDFDNPAIAERLLPAAIAPSPAIG
jgi:hypothetical protein